MKKLRLSLNLNQNNCCLLLIQKELLPHKLLSFESNIHLRYKAMLPLSSNTKILLPIINKRITSLLKNIQIES